MALKWSSKLLRKNSWNLLFENHSAKYQHSHHGLLSNEVYLEKVREYCREFIAPVEKEAVMKNIMNSFIDQLNITCFTDNKQFSPLITKNTFMQDFSTGKEHGQFLSLLIEEDKLEIMMVTIHNSLVKKSDKKILQLTKFQRDHYTTDMLVALVAEYVLDYVRDDIPYTELEGRLPPLVITYALPQWLDQISLNKGLIVRTQKGGLLHRSNQHELHELLTSMMQCWGFKLEIKCMMSFGSACFHDKQWNQRECIASVTLDHGVSICHVEPTAAVKGFDEAQVDRLKPNILLTTDLGEFGRDEELASISTEYDKTLDRVSSSAPGKKIFRKFVSETYVGEIFRLMALKLINDGLLLHSEVTFQIRRPYCLISEDVAYFENWMNNEKKCERVLKFKLGYDNYGIMDMVTLSYLADVVIDRSARLIALVIAALAERSTENEISFIFQGSFISQHRIIRHRLSEYVRLYSHHLKKNIRVLKASSDSALRGAAIFASRL